MNGFKKIFCVLLVTFLLLAVAGCIQSKNTQSDYANSSDNFSSIIETPVKYASVNGITIGYREFGSGDPLLVILPFSGTMDLCNDTFIRQLAGSYRVILFDNRGMGYSSDNNETLSISLLANDTAGLIDALGLPSAHIFGSSMGASIAQELALGYADKVDSLILSSATYSLDIPETEILKNYLQSVASNPDADPVLRKYAEANLEWNGTYEHLPEIQKRTLLLVGTEDVLTPANVSVIIAAQIPDAQLVQFEGAGHSGEKYAPEEYASEILDFLASE